MWFESEPVFRYWVNRGVEILEKMGIPLEHGVIAG